MLRLAAVTAALSAALLLAACAGNPGLDTPAPDPVANAVPPAPPPGTIVAGVIGSSIGLGLGQQDRERALAAEYQALEYTAAGVPVDWSAAGVTGEVVPGPIYTVNEYQCRDYTHTIVVNGATEAGRGTACRVAGGPWTPVA